MLKITHRKFLKLEEQEQRQTKMFNLQTIWLSSEMLQYFMSKKPFQK